MEEAGIRIHAIPSAELSRGRGGPRCMSMPLIRDDPLKVMVGCMTETSCGISAAAQFSPAVDFADLDGNLLIANDRFKGVLVEKGKLKLPTAPGIGVELI